MFASQTQNEVVLTARALLLNQELCSYKQRNWLSPWWAGTLVESLGLTPSHLDNLFDKTVLDLAGGASFFAAEATEAFRAKEVFVVDLNYEVYESMMKSDYGAGAAPAGVKLKTREAAKLAYSENMALLPGVMNDPGFTLQVIAWGDGSGVPKSGERLIVLGTDKQKLLHIRAFSGDGLRIVDTDEKQIKGRSADVQALKARLSAAQQPVDRAWIIEKALSLAGLSYEMSPPWAPAADWGAVHTALDKKKKEIQAAYFAPADKIHRLEGNAVDLSGLKDDQFDLAYCSWLLMYLSEDDRQKALLQLIRVTQAGGQIRVQAGNEQAMGGQLTGYKNEKYGPALNLTPAATAARFEIWFKKMKSKDFTKNKSADYQVYLFPTAGGRLKRVRCNTNESREALLVLDILPDPTSAVPATPGASSSKPR